MLEMAVNFYVCREGMINTGNRVNMVLGRKVPDMYWRLVYDAFSDLNFPPEAIVPGSRSVALCQFLHSRVDVSQALCDAVFRGLGLRNAPSMNSTCLSDANLLFNLGSIIPYRLIMSLLYCLVFWGVGSHEPSVRVVAKTCFVCFLGMTGYLIFDRALFGETHDYEGLWRSVCLHIASWHGLTPLPSKETQDSANKECLDFIGMFDNDPLLQRGYGGR
ncbi:ORF10 [callitrichine gammaherpesvirus 3]|uniref:ORF10 n=1 Tax=callitrichine gammaherpesvirus 3 TaxID=106331 RepID=Q993K0_9GAMA|nr:ORF10 [callitrichine gammaherpesvirus 3]AAK38218.1 ORF10 [callitrichine gammaherpesvirus 3]